MNIAVLIFCGLTLGSFVNALVWRIHKQSKASSKTKPTTQNRYSILKGRSMCPDCRHELAAKDLVPVFSWLSLGGKCRYCRKPISAQYPAVELLTAILFVVSYVFWPLEWNSAGIVNFVVWLVMLTGFMALIVYDLKWMLLPNRIVYPLTQLGLLLALYNVVVDGNLQALINTFLSVAVAGGIFYGLFQLSDGRWIGGGDVKLGILIGLILGDPYLAFLVLFLASLLGTFVIAPGMLLKKFTAKTKIPFGPFLIVATIIVQLFGLSIIEWYKQKLLLDI